MKTVVLDANELWRDLTCVSLRYQLIEHLGITPRMQVMIPAVVFEECVANYLRALSAAGPRYDHLSQREQRRLGLHVLPAFSEEAYREYLMDRFDRQLGFTVLPWPTVSHAEVVSRAVRRIRPFDSKGSGYRDTLVWMDVLRLATEGREVVLVSDDRRAFAEHSGALSDALAEEVTYTEGSVELVQEFEPWLLSTLPRATEDIVEAVKTAQDAELLQYCLESDLLAAIIPDVVDLGLARFPWSVILNEVAWTGEFSRAMTFTGAEGRFSAAYDLSFSVGLTAFFPALRAPRDEWVMERIDSYGLVTVVGQLEMVARLTVLFGGDVSFAVDAIEWRRADGVGPGESVYDVTDDETQPSLF